MERYNVNKNLEAFHTMSIFFWTNVISTVGILFINFYICKKSVNHKNTNIQKVIALLWCLVWALVFSIEPMPLLMIRITYCTLSIIYVWKLHKIKIDTALPAFLLAYGISNVFYTVAFFTVGFIFAPFLSSETTVHGLLDFNEPIFLLFYAIIAALQFLIAYLFFKIRRFKLGFPFLSGRYMVIAALIIAGIIIAGASLITSQRENPGTVYEIITAIVSMAVIGSGIYIWIRRSIKAFQWKKNMERNEELLIQENEKLTRQIQHYKEMHETVRIANHKMIHRQVVAERAVLKLYQKAQEYGLPAEVSDELAITIDKIRELSKEYQENIGITTAKALPSTNIQSVDDMFSLFATRFTDHNIEFNLKVNGSVVYMVDNIIKMNKLETMIGDHLQDALVAVNAADGEIRTVLAMIGEVDDCYEFSVQDSGIPFEVNTLTRLGLEKVTTHAEDDGSGIGFMTTFETMRECGASLIIKEIAPSSSFSKIITIRFDGKNNYIIKTFRPSSFPLNDRYTVVDCNFIGNVQ
jgi:hypothetical protein